MAELIAGTRNVYAHLYREDDGTYFLSIDGTEYRVSEKTAEVFKRSNVDGDTIRKRERNGDW